MFPVQAPPPHRQNAAFRTGTVRELFPRPVYRLVTALKDYCIVTGTGGRCALTVGAPSLGRLDRVEGLIVMGTGLIREGRGGMDTELYSWCDQIEL